METQHFSIHTRTVWAVALINLILTVMAVSIHLTQKWDVPETLTIALIVSNFLTCVIVLSDIVCNKVYNKPFWISSMLFLPAIASVFNLARRNKVMPKGKN